MKVSIELLRSHLQTAKIHVVQFSHCELILENIFSIQLLENCFFLPHLNERWKKIILFSSLSLDCFHYIVNFVYLTFSTLRHSVSETFIQFFQ